MAKQNSFSPMCVIVLQDLSEGGSPFYISTYSVKEASLLLAGPTSTHTIDDLHVFFFDKGVLPDPPRSFATLQDALAHVVHIEAELLELRCQNTGTKVITTDVDARWEVSTPALT